MNGSFPFIRQWFLLVFKTRSSPCTCTIRSFNSWPRGHEPLIRDSYYYTHLLNKCREAKSLREVHAQIITGGCGHNPFVAAKLMGKYVESSHSNMDAARKVFDYLPKRDVFVWNMVIQGYAKSGYFEHVLCYFNDMWTSGVSPNEYTFTFVLKACVSSKDVRHGETIHGLVMKCGLEPNNVFVCNALLAFYGKHGLVESSKNVFDGIRMKDVVSWNSMISSYVLNGLVNTAVTLLHAMMMQESKSTTTTTTTTSSCLPDRATLVSILPACAHASAIKEGLWVHSYVIKSGMELDAALGSGLISMYSNCGRLIAARKIFEQIHDKNKNIVVWNAIVRCYGTHGHADEALRMFSELVQTGTRPDGLIFLTLLSACSHAGKLTQGREVFEQMEKYQVAKGEEHFACMVDLLSRAGLIDEAVEFVKNMPLQAGKDTYGALLGACRIHGNVEIAEEVAGKLFALDLDSENAGRYILLAKMYEDAGRREDEARMRKLLKEKNIRKLIGYSAVEVDYVLHTFVAEDESLSHPFKEQILDMLKDLERAMEYQRRTVIDQVAVAL
ncbi:hypothetical protein Dimus_017423 [Dionaea muscipula]